MIKKYFTISEIAKRLKVKEHTLRSLDYLLGKNLTIVRGRRYYQEQDIKILSDFMSSTDDKVATLSYADNIENLLLAMRDLRSKLIFALRVT